MILQRTIRKNLILNILLLLGIFIGLENTLAQGCPANTTVSGTTANFVGELTDMGGDQTTAVWFEYGQTTAYGQKTNENILTRAESYCITVSGLLPLTTYHYKAAARNNAGTVFGEDKTFTTNPNQSQGNLTAQKMSANLSDGAAWTEQTYADPNEVIAFSIQVTGSLAQVNNVTIRDVLPPQMKFKGNLKVDNVAVAGDIISGLHIGSVAPGQTKTITFETVLLGPDKFHLGENKIINSAVVAGIGASTFDTTQITVTKTAAAAAEVVTDVSTGLTNNFFLDSFFLPLLISLIIIWFFKSRIIKFEEWKDRRAKAYEIYRADKMLRLKIAKIKAREFLQRKII